MAKKSKKQVKQEKVEEKEISEEVISESASTSEDVVEVEKTMEVEEENAEASENPMMNIFSMENKMRYSKTPEAEKLIEEELANANKKEKKEEKPVIDKHKDDSRTIFIGNLPIEVIQKPNLLKKQFAVFGPIQSMRFRSMALKSSRISHFDKKLMKKVSFITGNIAEDSKTTNAYIVYENEDSVEKALSLNNTVFMERHITVDTVTKKQHKSKNEVSRTLFIGNLPFDADEESLRQFFETNLQQKKSSANGEDTSFVESVKIIRSKDTRVGKGFAYVTLKSAVDTSLALFLNGKTFQDRELRVSKYLKTTEAIEKQKQKDAAKNGRMKRRNPRKFEKKQKTEKTEKKEKKEKKEKTEKKAKTEMAGEKVVTKPQEKPQEKKKERKPKADKPKNTKKEDLSFMGKRATLTNNAVNAKRRLLKKQKK